MYAHACIEMCTDAQGLMVHRVRVLDGSGFIRPRRPHREWGVDAELGSMPSHSETHSSPRILYHIIKLALAITVPH